ncbi:hypothetical protein [Streptomyces sp. NPDC005799]|uniref:hypothetical protein n=1 Tax=Streptomyces sp. NPDC005799 TaxID=3154678 RepID=UPI00340BC360
MSIDPGSFRPLPLHDERAEAARAEAEALLVQANKMHEQAQTEAQQIRDEARSLRTRTLAEATHEANQIRAAAKAEIEVRQQRDDKLDVWAARAIIAGTVGLTASGEYALARMVGFDRTVAWLLPFVIDVYVIQAFRRHRDIVQAISLTVAANVTYHLADKGLFGVEAVKNRHEPQWWLIAMVASVASLILWRVHLMTAPPKPARERRKQRQEARQVPVPQPTTAPPVPAPAADSSTAKTTVNSEPQEPPTGGDKKRQEPPAKKAPAVDKKPAQPRRQNTARSTAKKTANKRRSLDEWATDAGPVFHAEFARLRRNPTATEFATAISKAGLGKVSDSTAKNIRAEILDRTPLPELDDTQ